MSDFNQYKSELAIINQLYKDSDFPVYISDVDNYDILYANDALIVPAVSVFTCAYSLSL